MSNFSPSCAVILPIYKTQLSQKELSSLVQTFKILSDFDFILICAEGFNSSYYERLASNYGIYLKIERFKNIFFRSITDYNRLMISKQFYRRFIFYDFVLICQLDTWVFKNDLLYWCKQNYDYIGAPWFCEQRNGELVFCGIGNGGFSLRKIKSHLRVLDSFSFINKPGYLLYLLKRSNSLKIAANTLLNFIFFNNTYHLLNGFNGNEDIFWGKISNNNFKWFKVPPKEVALKFSIEMYPSSLIKSKNDLPFGCHAWEKYEPDFWSKFIFIA